MVEARVPAPAVASMSGHYACEVCGTTSVTIHRTSPKGELFRGRCGEHLERPADPAVTVVTDAIEERNERVRAER